MSRFFDPAEYKKNQENQYAQYKQMGWGEKELGSNYGNYANWLEQQAVKDTSAKAEYDRQQDMQRQKELQRVADLKNQGLNADGSPIGPEWTSLLGPDGKLNDKYQLSSWNDITANNDALNLYRKSALREAGQNSAWADLMLKKQEQEQAQGMDNAANSGAQNLLSTMSALAKSGGVSGAARERQIRSTNLNSMLDKNKVLRQGQMDRTGVLTQDEGNRLSGLQNLQGMENSRADQLFKNQTASKQIEQTNLMNLLKEIEGKRAFDQGNYKERMAAWGANKTAEAQAKAANSGGGKK